MRSLIIKCYRQLVPVHVHQGHLFFWAASGPLFLFAAFAMLLFRTSWELWPFVLISSIGLLASSLFKRAGFYFSFVSLFALASFQYKVLLEQPWCALFLAGTVLSWGIVLLGQEEISQWIGAQVQKKGDLEQSVHRLQEMVSLAHVQVEKEPKGNADEFKAALVSRDAAVENQNRAFEEIEKLRQQIDSLNEEITGYQRKEKAFQMALDDAQEQVIKYKYAEPLKAKEEVNPIVSQESDEENGGPLPPQEMRQLEHQYALLKEQFEEKSDALRQARKELFRLEGEISLLRMQEEEKRAESAEELAYQAQVQALIEQCQDLESQVISLEEIISTLSVKKKAAKPRKTKPRAKKGSLPEMLQEVIDHKNNQYSLLEE
ncbi:MAG: hypothetical protein KF898_04340 [Parachlamydiales bacterium]|nr:hypothetical protein [Verrucomicrobiota bacterium]MBX3718857.1 hypothetical protein [Candidatus Acheromyda pituitae]